MKIMARLVGLLFILSALSAGPIAFADVADIDTDSDTDTEGDGGIDEDDDDANCAVTYKNSTDFPAKAGIVIVLLVLGLLAAKRLDVRRWAR